MAPRWQGHAAMGRSSLPMSLKGGTHFTHRWHHCSAYNSASPHKELGMKAADTGALTLWLLGVGSPLSHLSGLVNPFVMWCWWLTKHTKRLKAETPGGQEVLSGQVSTVPYQAPWSPSIKTPLFRDFSLRGKLPIFAHRWWKYMLDPSQ